MKRHGIRILASAVLCSAAAASTVEFRCTPNGQGGVTLTYTVTAQQGETIRDFHIRTLDGSRVRGTGRPVDNGTPSPNDDWLPSKGNGWIRWVTGGPGIAAPNSIVFTVDVPDTTCAGVSIGAQWYTTSNGEKTVHLGNLVASGRHDPAGNPIRIACDDRGASLTALRLAAVGQVTPLALVAPMHQGEGYLIAASFGSQPGISLPGQHLPLNPDPLFWLSLQPNPVMLGFAGVVPPGGHQVAQLLIPPAPELAGLDLFLAAVTINPALPAPIRAVSDAEEIVISP